MNKTDSVAGSVPDFLVDVLVAVFLNRIFRVVSCREPEHSKATADPALVVGQ